MNYIKQLVKSGIRVLGFDLVRFNPKEPNQILVPRYLAPDAHKLIDFRQSDEFSKIAADIKAHDRTLLDYNRLFVLWQGVQNTHHLGHQVAEVGTYRGGSARFLAAALSRMECYPPIHVFDTFKGLPESIAPVLDGPHTAGNFGDTVLEQVREYLSSFPNVRIHVGDFQETRAEVEGSIFSLVHVDVDIYHSTVACLEFFWPRLCEGGVIVVDDYGFVTCKGAKQATDEFTNQHPHCQRWYMHSTGQFVMQKSL